MKFFRMMGLGEWMGLLLIFLFLSLPQIPTQVTNAKAHAQKSESIACDQLSAVPQADKNGYTSPTCIFCRVPSYTDDAFRKKINGSLAMSFVVGLDGRAHCARVTKTLDPGLDRASLKMVQEKWRFKPALGPDGKPAAVQITADVDFYLR